MKAGFRHRSGPDASRGAVSIMVAVMLVPITIFVAAVVEAGRVWVAKTTLQNGVEAAAIASATTWMKDGGSCTGPSLSFVSVDGSSPSKVGCDITGTNRRGTLQVSADEIVSLSLAKLLGRDTARISSTVRVKIAPAHAATGLWPLALCAEDQAVKSWLASGMTSTATWSINFLNNAAGCGGKVPGNWGMLDFNGGSNSTAETRDWVMNGYLESVEIGDIIAGNPGTPSTSLGLRDRIGSSVTFALFDVASPSGNNATFRIVGFARARIVDVVVTGSPSKTHLSITFEKGTTTGGPGLGDDTDYGVLSWGICSIESQGVCS
jgi:hypothetical protein